MFLCQIAGPYIEKQAVCSSCGRTEEIKGVILRRVMPEGWALVRCYPADTSPWPSGFEHYICSPGCLDVVLATVRNKMEGGWNHCQQRGA
jgi:hypothetical protein